MIFTSAKTSGFHEMMLRFNTVTLTLLCYFNTDLYYFSTAGVVLTLFSVI